jgi:4-hydroxy-tetrahydrodipicolinate synthase
MTNDTSPPLRLGSVITALITPFDDKGSVDYARFGELARLVVDHGSDGIVVAGTTGESPTLTAREKLGLLAVARDAVGARATIIAGTGTYDTRASVEMTQRAHELGVNGFLVVAPYYSNPPQRGIVRHFEEVAAATDRPIVAYNVPSRVVVKLELPTIAELERIENVAAVKQAHPDTAEARFIATETRFELYAGDDNLTFGFARLGAVGVISVISHLWGAQLQELISAQRAGKSERASALDTELRPAYDLLTVATNPIAIKAALNVLGLQVGRPRLPLVEADERELEQVRACLAAAPRTSGPSGENARLTSRRLDRRSGAHAPPPKPYLFPT